MPKTVWPDGKANDVYLNAYRIQAMQLVEEKRRIGWARTKGAIKRLLRDERHFCQEEWTTYEKVDGKMVRMPRPTIWANDEQRGFCDALLDAVGC